MHQKGFRQNEIVKKIVIEKLEKELPHESSFSL